MNEIKRLTKLDSECNIHDHILEILMHLEDISRLELFGNEDLRVLTVSFGILVKYGILPSLNFKMPLDKRLEKLFPLKFQLYPELQNSVALKVCLHFVGCISNAKYHTIGPRELILNHHILELFLGLINAQSDHIHILLDNIPLKVSFRVLLTISSMANVSNDFKKRVGGFLSGLLCRDFGISSLLQVLSSSMCKYC